MRGVTQPPPPYPAPPAAPPGRDLTALPVAPPEAGVDEPPLAGGETESPEDEATLRRRLPGVTFLSATHPQQTQNDTQ